MTKEEFYKHLDSLTDGTGFDFDDVSKAFAFNAAKSYHESQVKTCDLADVGGNEVAVCGCNSWNRNLNAFTGKCLTCGKKV